MFQDMVNAFKFSSLNSPKKSPTYARDFHVYFWNYLFLKLHLFSYGLYILQTETCPDTYSIPIPVVYSFIYLIPCMLSLYLSANFVDIEIRKRKKLAFRLLCAVGLVCGGGGMQVVTLLKCYCCFDMFQEVKCKPHEKELTAASVLTKILPEKEQNLCFEKGKCHILVIISQL